MCTGMVVVWSIRAMWRKHLASTPVACCELCFVRSRVCTLRLHSQSALSLGFTVCQPQTSSVQGHMIRTSNRTERFWPDTGSRTDPIPADSTPQAG